jgi:3-deoxy-7-phosphoheptulonate synthase
MFIEWGTVLNPDREPGRLTLITRYGASKVGLLAKLGSCTECMGLQIEQYLPSHIRAVQDSGMPVVWICDPMHGKLVIELRG